VATAAVIGGVFLITLLIVSIITVKISDMVLDSRIGASTVRSASCSGSAAASSSWWWRSCSCLARSRPKQPDGVRNAKSLEVLNKTGEWLQALCRRTWIIICPSGSRNGRRTSPTRPMQHPVSVPISSPPDVTGSVGARAGYPGADRTDMRQLIDATKGTRR